MSALEPNDWTGTPVQLAKAFPPEFANGPNGYIRIGRDGKVHYLHRWLWEHFFGPIPDGWEIDHINGIKTDNRLKNLRCVTHNVNRRNMKTRSDNTSGVLGVSRWVTTRRGDQKIEMWRATANDKSGKQVIKAFSINKWGEDGAFILACNARKQMDIDYGYHPNHGRK